MQEIHLDLDHENFFCPITGALIRNDEMFEPSAATVFTFIDEVGEVEPLTPEMEVALREIQSDDDKSTHDVFERFKRSLSDDAIVCFTITTRGMACGPVSSTIRIGIDMNYEAPAMDD